MATSPPKQDPRTVVRTSNRLWSDVVRAARGDDLEMRPYDPAYRFNNGNEFVELKPFYTRLGDGNGS